MKANEFVGIKQDSESKVVAEKKEGKETPTPATITRYVVVWLHIVLMAGLAVPPPHKSPTTHYSTATLHYSTFMCGCCHDDHYVLCRL